MINSRFCASLSKTGAYDTEVLAEQLEQEGVLIKAGAPFFNQDSPPNNFFRLAYFSIKSEKIADGIGLITKAIDEY